MPKSSSSRVPAPKTSSSAAFSAPAITSKPTHSSILKTAFAPSELDIPLFASTIRSLDSERLRVHDTLTGELKSVHAVSGSSINCIRWGSYGQEKSNDSMRKKKRKLENGTSSSSNGSTVVIAVGSGHADIELFSPLEGKVTAKLSNAHERGTRDFVFENLRQAWSLGIDSSITQWNLEKLSRVRNIEAPTNSLTRLVTFSSSLLLASQSAHLYNPKDLEIKTIPCFTSPIHTLIPQPASKHSTPAHFIAAAESTSTIGVYNPETLSITGNLNAKNPSRTVSLFSQGKTSLLCAISETGEVEIFDSPFQNWSSPGDDLKTKRRKTTRRSQSTVQVREKENSNSVSPVVDAIVDSQGALILAIVEDSVNIGFERIPLLNDSGALVIQDVETVLRPKTKSLANASTNGTRNAHRSHVNDSQVVVGESALDRESASEDEDVDVEEVHSEDGQAQGSFVAPTAIQTNGTHHDDTEMTDANDDHDDKQEERDDEEGVEPTFGELIKARGIGTVEVSDSRALEAIPGNTGTLSSNLTLATLLTQALNTNDSASLDTCLGQQDLQVIRATIERLDSGLAITLLHRLAERLHRRPGRAGSLLVWVQWTIVSHGGYLSSRPDTVQKLRSLHKIVQERAKSLQPLLALKGKLDMLDAQITFRKRLYESRMASAGPTSRPEDMIYVEGQSESDTDEEQARIEGFHRDDELEEEDDDDEEDEEQDEEEVTRLLTQEGEDGSASDSDGADGSSASDLSGDEEIEGEIDHDDVDPEDSDTSTGGLSGPRINGTKS